MNTLHSIRSLAVAALVFGAAALGFAQTASFTADTSSLAAGGGFLSFVATATYEGQPGAVGWSIELPKDWSLVSVSGANLPGIASEPGSSGALEFAYITIPADRAEFRLVVRYPAGTMAAKIGPTVLIRANGKLITLAPSPVEFARR